MRRSCIPCRRRKVKCDRAVPCANCTKMELSCRFPDPNNPIRRPRKPATKDAVELLKRLKTLERVVEQWSAPSGKEDDSDALALSETAYSASSGQSIVGDGAQPPPQDRGKLLVSEEKSRYVNSNFWTSLTDEVEGITSLLLDESDDDDTVPATFHDSRQAWKPQAFLLGFSSLMLDLSSLQPNSTQVSFLWDTFVNEVDLRVKFLHKPTLHKRIVESRSTSSNVPKDLEPLMYAIYHAAVAQASPDECKTYFNEEKQSLLSKYRFATEQALTRADFLTTAKVITLQALVLLMIPVHQLEESRLVWALVGIAARLAQSAGLHRDGKKLALPPFETEMRRRLWWQIYAMDTRTAEDHGTTPCISHMAFDTEMPLNINDDDIFPGMAEEPKSREGRTESSFTLLRLEISHTLQRINPQPANLAFPERARSLFSLAEKEDMIHDCHNRLESLYLKYFNISVEPDRYAILQTRLMMARMWITIYYPLTSKGDTPNPLLTQAIRERLFLASIEVIEYSRLLIESRQPFQSQRSWLLRLYFEWQAVRFILSELQLRTSGELFDRGWRAIDVVSGDWGELAAKSKNGAVWRPMEKLLHKANKTRASATAMATSDCSNTVIEAVDHGMMLAAPPAELAESSQGSYSVDSAAWPEALNPLNPTDEGLSALRPGSPGLEAFSDFLEWELSGTAGSSQWTGDWGYAGSGGLENATTGQGPNQPAGDIDYRMTGLTDMVGQDLSLDAVPPVENS